MQHYSNQFKIESSYVQQIVMAVGDILTWCKVWCFEEQEKAVWTESECEFQLLQMNAFFLIAGM